MIGSLYVVATPIGNLEDVTPRALRVLKEVDWILAEDTRRVRILLDRYQIATPTRSYHQHSKGSVDDVLIDQLVQGKMMALVTDAGTPGVADPGGRLVARSHEQGIRVIPIPGPSALTTALSVCGLPADDFLFLGFLPKKAGRSKLIEEISQSVKSDRTVVVYESPYRIIKTLTELENRLSQATICVGRELTKKFEEIERGSLNQVIDRLKAKPTKGEYVMVIGKEPSSHE